jgi:hypothetical protein
LKLILPGAIKIVYGLVTSSGRVEEAILYLDSFFLWFKQLTIARIKTSNNIFLDTDILIIINKQFYHPLYFIYFLFAYHKLCPFLLLISCSWLLEIKIRICYELIIWIKFIQQLSYLINNKKYIKIEKWI